MAANIDYKIKNPNEPEIPAKLPTSKAHIFISKQGFIFYFHPLIPANIP